MLADAEQRPDDATRFEEFGIGYIEDVIAALEWSDGASTEPGVAEDVFDEGLLRGDGLNALWTPAEPIKNPWRHVGRNDPCPCGSGKKGEEVLLGKQPMTVKF